MTKEIMAARFRALRAKTGLSQPKFASCLGIPEKTYTKWELGVRCPPTYVYTLIERLLILAPLNENSKPEDVPITLEYFWNYDVASNPPLELPTHGKVVVMADRVPPLVGKDMELKYWARIEPLNL